MHLPEGTPQMGYRWGTGGVPGVPGGYFWGLFGAYSSISGTPPVPLRYPKRGTGSYA